MFSAKRVFVALVVVLAMFFAASCGGDDDDSDRATGDDDDAAPLDDDLTDDDSTDDDADDDVDDDATDDDADDDVIDDDTVDDDTMEDNEFVPIICSVPDPLSIGDGVTVGGGAIVDHVSVYVFAEEDLDADDACDPVQGANVNGVLTGADGLAEVPAAKAATMVVAKKDGYWSWAYKADAAVMYFRLRPAMVGAYTDSDPGQFTFGGSPLAVSNPQGEYTLEELLDTPFYLGGAMPAIIRQAAFSTDPMGITPATAAGFPISYTYQIAGGELHENFQTLPGNFYLPSLDFSSGIPLVLPTVTGTGDHENFVVPVHDYLAEKSVAGVVFSANFGAALSAEAVVEIAQEFLATGDIVGALLTQADALINDALKVEYSGADVDWDGTGAPAIELVQNAGEQTVAVTVANADPNYDYLLVLAAEIPNRAWWPIGLKLADASGQATFTASPVPDADYTLIVAKTDVLDGLASGATYIRLSFALEYAENLEDWSAGVTLDDADFLPLFDPAQTEYTAGGVVNWQLEAGDAPDVVTLLIDPVHDELLDEALAVVPAADSSFDAATTFAFTPNQDGTDVIGVFAVDLPAEVDPDSFDPLSLMGYNFPRASLWINYDLSSLLP